MTNWAICDHQMPGKCMICLRIVRHWLHLYSVGWEAWFCHCLVWAGYHCMIPLLFLNIYSAVMSFGLASFIFSVFLHWTTTFLSVPVGVGCWCYCSTLQSSAASQSPFWLLVSRADGEFFNELKQSFCGNVFCGNDIFAKKASQVLEGISGQRKETDPGPWIASSSTGRALTWGERDPGQIPPLNLEEQGLEPGSSSSQGSILTTELLAILGWFVGRNFERSSFLSDVEQQMSDSTLF